MGWLRYPKTTQERRNDEWARAKRNFRNLPNAYDDIIRTVQRSWKEHRSTQYHAVDMSEEPHERKRRRCRTRPLDSKHLMEARHAATEQTTRSQVVSPPLLPADANNPGEATGPRGLGTGEEELPQPAEPLGRFPQAPRPVLEELQEDAVQDTMKDADEKKLSELVNQAHTELINMGVFMKLGSHHPLIALARQAYELGEAEGSRPKSIQEALEACKRWRMTDEEEAELMK